LLFDPASQKATLEPLSDSYTFNLTTKNNKNISSQNTKIYPKKSKEEQQDGDGEEDLFGEAAAEDESGDPDPANPYDFRHFLGKEKEKRGDESDFISSPDYRTGTGSAMNTPQFGARKPVEAAAPKAKPAEPAPKRAKPSDASMFMKKKIKPTAKATQPPPSIHLERHAPERPVPDAAPKPKSKPAGPLPSRIKSTELVQSSDESDADAEGESEPVPSPPRRPRSPSPQYHAASDPSDQDADGDSESDDGILEIEVPDARPRPGAHRSLAVASPAGGPISLASAANSPGFRSRAPVDDGIIDFGDVGEDEEEEDEDAEGDVDVDMIDIGPPARSAGAERKASMGGAAEEDEDDPLYAEMMAGLAGGDSSEESEEE
jgi:hypothetical protein